jgi:hypothetical protein
MASTPDRDAREVVVKIDGGSEAWTMSYSISEQVARASPNTLGAYLSARASAWIVQTLVLNHILPSTGIF